MPCISHQHTQHAGHDSMTTISTKTDMSRFPEHIRPHLIPGYTGDCVYTCIACSYTGSLDTFLYTCPECGSLLKISDRSFDELKKIPGPVWRDIFDYRLLLRDEALQGIFLFKEVG